MKSQPGSFSAELDLTLNPEATVKLLTRFIRQEVERTGLRDVVFGLSGGIDSALVAGLAVQALGAQRVHPIRLPHELSSESSLSDAALVAETFNLKYETIDITPMVDGFEKSAGQVSPHRLGNVMSRCRMMVLYDRSAEHGALVLGTSNKTELLLGYGTQHGDLASALNPIGDLYKAQVRQLSSYIGVPQSVIDKPPSADLVPDQTDEDDLGFTYEQADQLLALLIDARVSPDSAIKYGFDADLVADVIKRIRQNQFKRCIPVIAKLSTRSIGWDFRYPRDWFT